MYAPSRQESKRGASVLAALILIAVLGVVAAGMQYLSHSSAVAYQPSSQGAQAAASAASAQTSTQQNQNQCPAQSQADQDAKPSSAGGSTDVTCLPGQVHKIDMTTGAGATQQDQVSDCLVQQTDPKTGKPVTNSQGAISCIANPNETNNKDCALKNPTQCVVEYCPPAGVLSSGASGGCFVVKSCTSANCVTDLTSGYLQREAPTTVAALALANNSQAVVLPSSGQLNGAQWLTQALSTTPLSSDPEASMGPSAASQVQNQLQQWASSGSGNVDLDNPLTTTASEVAAGSAPCVTGAPGCTPAAQLNSALSQVQTETPPPTLTTGGAVQPPAPGSQTPNPASPSTLVPGGALTQTPPGSQTGNPVAGPANGLCPAGQTLQSDGSCTLGAAAPAAPAAAPAAPPAQSGVGCVMGLNGQLNCGLSVGGNSSNSGLNNLMQEMMLMNMLKSLTGQTSGTVAPGNQTPYAAGTCNTQYTCSGNTLYYQQNTCVQTPYQQCQNGCDPSGTSCAATSPYGVGTDGNACAAPVPAPAAASCTGGTWQPISAGNGCIDASWQCVSGNQSSPATLTCTPQTADVGTQVAINYSCTGAASATGGGFSTGGNLSGATSTTITAPPAGTNTATYTLTCTNSAGQNAGAQCAVQINQPSIVLVANPSSVPSGQNSTIGWVTTGMQSCAVSDNPDTGFNAQNVSNTSANGVATLSNITGTTDVTLTCTTLGGGTKTATTEVQVGSASTTSSAQVSVSSSVDGGSISHGSAVTVNWNSTSAPTGSAMSLWLVDEKAQTADALIAGDQAVSGSYTWNVPATGSSCDGNAANVCASDLVAGNNYAVEAVLYSPSNAYIGDGDEPPNPVSPSWGASAVGGTFSISQ